MSMSSMAGIGSYTASAGGDTLYPITIQVKNTQGGFTPVQVLSDSGNEITLLKKEVADSLGLDLNRGESFKVAGINGTGRLFKRFVIPIKIGTLQPVPVTVGFATKEGDLAENLLGNKDILKSGKFEALYDENGVTFTQKSLNARISGCGMYDSEQEVLNNLYDHLTSRRQRHKKCGCGHDHGYHEHQYDDDLKDGGTHNSIAGYGIFF